MQQCRPIGWQLRVRDHQGRILATQPVDSEPWPGTAALYSAEFRVAAPDVEGLFGWQVLADGSDAQGRNDDTEHVCHPQAQAKINVRTVGTSECRLTVIAIDRASGAPVAGLKVVAHPFRSMTDERGIAELDIPKGAYRLFVSGRNFFPLRLDGELNSDQTIRAELEPDTGPSDAEIWT